MRKAVPVSSLSAGAFHIPAARKIHKRKLSQRAQASASRKSQPDPWELEIIPWTSASRGAGFGRTPFQGLSQEQIVYIKYFHIEIFIYFHINESSQCALGRKFFCFLEVFLYSSWIFVFVFFFGFLRIIPSVKFNGLKKSRAFTCSRVPEAKFLSF